MLVHIIMHIREIILFIISYQLMQFSVCAHVDYMYVQYR